MMGLYVALRSALAALGARPHVVVPSDLEPEPETRDDAPGYLCAPCQSRIESAGFELTDRTIRTTIGTCGNCGAGTRWAGLVLLLVLAVCRPPVEALSCSSSAECETLWPEFAPICHDGMCSECDTDGDCALGFECVDNWQGFGTCLGVLQ